MLPMYEKLFENHTHPHFSGHIMYIYIYVYIVSVLAIGRLTNLLASTLYCTIQHAQKESHNAEGKTRGKRHQLQSQKKPSNAPFMLHRWQRRGSTRDPHEGLHQPMCVPSGPVGPLRPRCECLGQNADRATKSARHLEVWAPHAATC